MLQVPYVNRPRQLGEISSSFRELESLRGLLSNTTLTVSGRFTVRILFIGIIAFMHPALAMPALVALTTLVLIALLAGRLAANSQSGLTKTSQQQASVLIEGFGQYETIKSMALEDSQVQDRWEGQAAERSEFQDKARFLAGLPSHFSAAISMLASAGVVVVGAYLVAEQQISMGVLIAAMILNRAIAPASGGFIQAYQRHGAGSTRV